MKALHEQTRSKVLVILWVTLAGLFPVGAGADDKLAGVWASHVIHGPARYGRLVVWKSDARYIAQIADFRGSARADDGTITFSLPDGSRFDGRVSADGDIRGHWLQPPSKLDGNVFATPVHLRAESGRWQGEIVPQPDTVTLFLLIEADGDGLTAELINPDRNLGVFQDLTRVVRQGNDITFMGHFLGRGEEQPMLRGTYLPDEDVIALRYPWRGGGYDFRRVEPATADGFLTATELEAARLGVALKAVEDKYAIAVAAIAQATSAARCSLPRPTVRRCSPRRWSLPASISRRCGPARAARTGSMR